MNKPIRVAHLISHPIQYYVHLYRAISLLPEIELTVYYFSDVSVESYFDQGFQKEIKWDIDLLGGYKSVFLKTGKGGKKKYGFFRKPDWSFLFELSQQRYDVIWVHGYQDINIFGAKVIAFIQQKVFLVREDQTLLEPRSRTMLLIKRLLFRLFFFGSRSGGLFTGINSREHFKYFGVKDIRLFPACHCVDDVTFTKNFQQLKLDRKKIRNDFGILDDAPVVLFSGKLIDKKQPLRLIEAFARVVEKNKCWLLIVGDGPLLEKAKDLSSSLGIDDRVVFAGFLNQQDLSRAYISADLFVLPSLMHETWGLVVNEAMHFSLPIIVSDHVGCAPDLVHVGVNGYIVPAMCTEQFSETIEKIVVNDDLRKDFSDQSATLIRGFTINACAKQIAFACKSMHEIK